MPQNSGNNHANPKPGSSRHEDASSSESTSQNADLAAEIHRFDASNAEEIDALEVDLEQDGDEIRDQDDGSGLIEDELARDQVEEMTESGPELVDKGVDSVAPGQANTSETLRRHYRTTGIQQAEIVTEDTIDEPRDEAFTDRQA
jgi:transcription termination/antitermination protein NusA